MITALCHENSFKSPLNKIINSPKSCELSLPICPGTEDGMCCLHVYHCTNNWNINLLLMIIINVFIEPTLVSYFLTNFILWRCMLCIRKYIIKTSESLFQSCKMNKLCYHTILTQNHVMLDLSCNIIRSTAICLMITYVFWFLNSDISFLVTCHPQPVEDKQCRKSFNILVYNAVLHVKHWKVFIQLHIYYNITARTFLIIWPNNNCIKWIP